MNILSLCKRIERRCFVLLCVRWQPQLRSIFALVCILFLGCATSVGSPRICNTVKSNNVFGRDLVTSILVAEGLSELQYRAPEMNVTLVGFLVHRFQVHAKMIEHIVWTPQHHSIGGTVKGFQPLVGVVGATLLPLFKEVQNGNALLLDYGTLLLVQSGDESLNPPDKKTTENAGTENGIKPEENVLHCIVHNVNPFLLGLVVGMIAMLLVEMVQALWRNRSL